MNELMVTLANCYGQTDKVKELKPGEPYIHGLVVDLTGKSGPVIFDRTLENLEMVVGNFLHDYCGRDPDSDHHAMILTCGGSCIVIVRKAYHVGFYEWHAGPGVFTVKWRNARKFMDAPENFVDGATYIDRAFNDTARAIISEAHVHHVYPKSAKFAMKPFEADYVTDLLSKALMVYINYDFGIAVALDQYAKEHPEEGEEE